MSNVQTDNSFFEDKVALRLNHLPTKKSIKVLDIFGGDANIWDKIKKVSDKKIEHIRIDMKSDKSGAYLLGDNTKFLKAMDLSSFDIIDVDAYGIPFTQLEIIFNSNINPVIFITYVQTVYGILPLKMLYKIGYSKTMVKKCPSLFSRNGYKKLLAYLSLYGYKKTYVRKHKRKVYCCVKPLKSL
jgi:hypothetical protein